jgi:hypothetical protein
MIFPLIFTLFLFSSAHAEEISIPFEKQKWFDLSYSSIPKNETTFEKDHLSIRVNKSAGPLVFSLDQPVMINQIELELELEGDILLHGSKQGSKGFDDFHFRIGMVLEGDKKLGFFQAAVAPKWIKTLYSLAGKDQGIDRIHFYNVYVDESLKDKKREHPLSDLLVEEFAIPYEKSINYKSKLDLKKKVLALWISSDGDDTKSSYLVKIKKIKLWAY